MNIFMVSVFLAAVTVCSSHRQTSRGRTSFVTRAQIGRICNEIVTLKEEIGTLKEENGNQQKEIVSLKEEIGQQKEELSQQKEEIGQQEEEISQLKHKNIEYQNRIEDLEQSSTGAGPQSAVQSAFALYGQNPIEAESTVGYNVITVPTSGVKTNIGDDFNVTTGVYTAPIDGTYVFILNLYKKDTVNDRVYCYIRRNSEDVAIANVPDFNDFIHYHGGTGATVLSLKQGDTVYAGDCSEVDHLYYHTNFMGFLLAVEPSEEE